MCFANSLVLFYTKYESSNDIPRRETKEKNLRHSLYSTSQKELGVRKCKEGVHIDNKMFPRITIVTASRNFLRRATTTTTALTTTTTTTTTKSVFPTTPIIKKMSMISSQSVSRLANKAIGGVHHERIIVPNTSEKENNKKKKKKKEGLMLFSTTRVSLSCWAHDAIITYALSLSLLVSSPRNTSAVVNPCPNEISFCFVLNVCEYFCCCAP